MPVMPGPTAAADPSVDAVYRAWRAAQVDADLVHEAVEQIRAQGGRNVIVVMEARFAELEARIEGVETRLGARIDIQSARIERSESELGARIERSESELGARIDAQSASIEGVETRLGARIDAQSASIERVESELGARIDGLTERVESLQKVLWPLVIALCVTLLSVVGGGLFALLRG